MAAGRSAGAADAVAWVTAADLDGRRHLAARTVSGWVAMCGVTFSQRETRPVIPRRCADCPGAAEVLADLDIIPSPDLRVIQGDTRAEP